VLRERPVTYQGALVCTAGKNGKMTPWEYLIVALPRFELPTAEPEPSAALQILNAEGGLGWEAVGMTALTDGSVAVLLKRPVEVNNDDADQRLLRRLRARRVTKSAAVDEDSAEQREPRSVFSRFR
jgi:hypothetical protein